jgi:hypothetical protein
MEKPLNQVAWEAMNANWNMGAEDSWQAVADAVVAEHEARRWKPIKALGEETIRGTIGRWRLGEWETQTGYLYLPHWVKDGWTHVCTPITALPAPPTKEESDAS